MSLQVDSSAPWRSTALGRGIAPRYVTVRAASKGNQQTAPSSESAVTDVSTDSWLRDLSRMRMPEEVARNGMLTGAVNADYEVASVDSKSADSSVGRLATLPYSYTGNNSTNVQYTFAGKCITVRPAINEAVVSAMYSAPTADKWVQATGIKLPRVMAQSQLPGSVPGLPSLPEQNASNQQGFDSLRRHVVSCARGDDYGDRLFQLARVVLHAQVLHTTRMSPEVTPAMQAVGLARSIAAADTPNLLPDQLRAYTYLYVHTDTSADYRAFLAMGVRGVQHYTGRFSSVYSACVSEEEARPTDEIVYVRVGGDAPSPASPGADAYTRVLANPGACLAYYYAYAQSMGLGRMATAVLVQAALAPHIWGENAISPYKTGQPRLDACTYVLLPDQDVTHVVMDDLATLVHSASIVSTAYKAAIGGALMSYKSNRQVDDTLVVEQYIERLTDPEARRPLLSSITACLFSGAVGLEWFSPFSYDVNQGYLECVEAYRNYSFLLAIFNTCPISGLTPLFSGGVDMSNSMVGQGMADAVDAYAQTTAILLAAGCQALGCCERWPVRVTANLPQMAALTRSWKAVVTLLRFTSVHPHTSKLEDSPGRWRKSQLHASTDSSGAANKSVTSTNLSSPPPSKGHERVTSDTAIPVRLQMARPRTHAPSQSETTSRTVDDVPRGSYPRPIAASTHDSLTQPTSGGPGHVGRGSSVSTVRQQQPVAEPPQTRLDWAEEMSADEVDSRDERVDAHPRQPNVISAHNNAPMLVPSGKLKSVAAAPARPPTGDENRLTGRNIAGIEAGPAVTEAAQPTDTRVARRDGPLSERGGSRTEAAVMARATVASAGSAEGTVNTARTRVMDAGDFGI